MRRTRDLIPVDDEVTRHARTRLGSFVRDRWRLDALLGVGGMAAVYAATHRNNGKRVAIKMLHPELSTSGEIRQRFIDEGYAANRVGHPGAVSVLDDDVAEDGAAFLVMDLLEGETLEARLQRIGRLEPSQVLAITDALLDVLAAAHAEGIVHRDIKPDNIFITTEGVVMLLDFGIARMVMEGRPRTTLSGATMGTPAFMAPEQARGRWEDLDGRTDLWAVGATMFVQLTGRVVHVAETTNEELLCAMTKPAPSLAELAPELPRSLIALVDRALAFEQRARFSDARAMQAEVRAVYAQMKNGRSSITAHEPEPIPSTSPITFVTPHGLIPGVEGPRRKRGGTAIVLTCGVALVAAALAFGATAERGSRVAPAVTVQQPAVVEQIPEPQVGELRATERNATQLADTAQPTSPLHDSAAANPGSASSNAKPPSDARSAHAPPRSPAARPAAHAEAKSSLPEVPAPVVVQHVASPAALVAPAVPSDPLARRK